MCIQCNDPEQVKIVYCEIDDNSYEVEADKYTLLQICTIYRIDIPRFCYHERLSIAGNCRMCLVEDDVSEKLLASCAVVVEEGETYMYTASERVKIAREGVLEFLLINHPLDCPICDQGGECDLQDQSLVFGSDRGRFYEFKRAVSDKDLGPFIKTSMNRCIHCTRCVRYFNEVVGISSLGITGRGNKMEINTYVNNSIDYGISGNVIDLCPVGALTSKPYAFIARPWELISYDSIDVFDVMHSNIRLDIRGTRIMRVLPRINGELNADWITDKIRFFYDSIRVQRLTAPLLRRVNKNEFVVIS